MQGIQRNSEGVVEKNREKETEKEAQLRVFIESDRPFLYWFYGKSKMLLAIGQGIWMYHR